MKLYEINFIPTFNHNLIIINEGYSRTYNFDYQGDQVTDPRPKALSLGRWRSGRGNNLMAGINLNYLSQEQIKRLQQNLPRILRNRNLQRRVRTLRSLMPDVFNSAYRTYNKDAVDNVEKGTLRFLKTKKDEPEDLSRTRPQRIVPDIDDKVTPDADIDDKEDQKFRPSREEEPKQKPEQDLDQKEEPDKDEEPDFNNRPTQPKKPETTDASDDTQIDNEDEDTI